MQFSKLANLYFLIIGGMQIIPQVSISNSIPVIFLPLSVIVVVSGLKDLYEDYQRHQSDKEENNRKVQVLVNGEYEETPWKDLRVGNIIKVMQDKEIPADLLLLKSSEAKGICFIETKSLDGETNLKMKNVSSEILKIFQTEKSVMDEENRIILKYEAPNPYLYRFYGEVIDKAGKNSPINFNNIVLRGCILRNIKYIIGVVAYTGHDTKIMMNSIKARSKKSKLEIQMQHQIFYIFITQMLICLFGAVYYLIWYIYWINNLEYLKIDKDGVVDNSPEYNFFVRCGNWILIFTNFVPISLLVTLEMVKLIQGFFIIYDKALNLPTVQSSNLNEELGQIEYVFSDKTGTLTCNVMEFKQITIGLKNYGAVDHNSSHFLHDLSAFPRVSNVDFRDQTLFAHLNNKDGPEHQTVVDCIFYLALCHSIITDTKDGELVYNASSPDELALVNFARFCGVQYLGIDENNIMSVKFKNQVHQFQLLEAFEFTSGRKRQSVLLKFLENNEIWLYTKGADSILLDPLRLAESELSKLDIMKKNLQQYGELGLRTLVLCRRKIDDSEYEMWNANYKKATTQLEGRAEKMQDLQDKLETQLKIVGCTAIEDKLQANVGQTIDAIKKAGIKVWVLTGDKIETAINIGYSCKLLTNKMKQYVIDEKEEIMIKKSLNEILAELQGIIINNEDGQLPSPNDENQKLNMKTKISTPIPEIDRKETVEHALIISGESLFHALKPGISSLVMEIAEQCSVVLCCRVSPKQKQDVVALVRKEKPQVSTLAIGDGANDVNMITAAHVGIGIRGVEGQQAARASDYSVQEFQELRRLLFYHGRESYRRNSVLVCYNFFKNVLLVLPQFWYGVVSVFSAQSLYDSFLYQLYNILYASMPIIIYAVFDEQYDPEILVLNQPNYYAQGIHNLLFNTKVFWLWVLNAIWQAAIICYFSTFINGDNFISPDGYTSHVWANGTMVYGLVVLVSNFKVLSLSNTFTIAAFIGIFGSLLSYLISWIIIDTIQSAEAHEVFDQLWNTPNFHLGNIVTLGATSIIDLSIELYLRWNRPQISQNLSKSEELKRGSEQLKQYSLIAGPPQQKGRIMRHPTSHTGFAFCALEKESEQKFKEYQKY